MFFWIPLALTVIGIGVIIWWGLAEMEDWEDILKVSLGVAGLGVFIGFVLFVAVASIGVSDAGTREIAQADLVKFEDGSYVEVRYTEGGTLYTVQQKENGVVVPRTFDTFDLITTSERKGETIEIQNYLDNGWVWPWPLEGYSWGEIHVPDGTVTIK